MDRSLNRILSLPLFDDEFVRALKLVRLDHVEFWLAVVDDRSIAVDSKLAGLVSASPEDQTAKDLLLNRLDLLTMLAHLIEKSRPRIEGEIATDLGFRMSFGSAKSGPPDQGGRLAITMGGEVPLLPAKRPAPTGSRVEVTSLQNEEQIEKTKWAARLKQIAQKAGDAAKINDTSCMPGVSRAEQEKLKAIVFEAGGHRTIRQNVRAWEKFEEWAAHWFLSVYPPDTSTVTKYCLYLSQDGCGPAVIPSFKYAVGWICRRLVMTPPDLKSGGIVAIEEKVHTDRGKELKEAIPISLHLVGALEHLLVYQSPEPEKEASTVFLFWILILIYGSLRFDDGKHVSPSSLTLERDALYGLIWQTKVERKRKGTRFAVPKCSVSGADWFSIGWTAFQPFRDDRDFFIWDLKTEREFDRVPVTYTRSMAWMKSLFTRALNLAIKTKCIHDGDREKFEKEIQTITWHSMRVTMLSAAVEAGVDDKAIGLQANWKDPGPLVLKYARKRKDISVGMVRNLAAQLREQWKPDPEEFTVEDRDDIVEPVVIEYVLKNNASAAKITAADVKFHIFHPAHNPTQTLCGRLEIADCLSFGAEPPGDVCKICLAKNSGGRTVALEGWSSEGVWKTSQCGTSFSAPFFVLICFFEFFNQSFMSLPSVCSDRAYFSFWKTATSQLGRDLDPEVLAQLVTMVDRTTYSDEARTPKIALRQIFGRLGLRQELCKLAADSGLLSIEVVAMLGDTAAAVKATLKTLVDPAALGVDEAARELSLMQIAAVWHACHALQTQFATRRAKMEEDPSKVPEMAQEDHAEFRGRFVRNHPDVVLLDAKEPHKKFVEKLSRDFLVHGMVPFYAASEIRTRSDTISQKTGLTRTAEDLLTVSKADEPDQVTDVHTLLNRIHAFFMALEYLNICGYSRAAGPLRYMQELEQFRIDCPGLPYVMAADSLIRKKIYRLQSEQRETYGSFQEALLEVIKQPQVLVERCSHQGGSGQGGAQRSRASSRTRSSSNVGLSSKVSQQEQEEGSSKQGALEGSQAAQEGPGERSEASQGRAWQEDPRGWMEVDLTSSLGSFWREAMSLLQQLDGDARWEISAGSSIPAWSAALATPWSAIIDRLLCHHRRAQTSEASELGSHPMSVPQQFSWGSKDKPLFTVFSWNFCGSGRSVTSSISQIHSDFSSDRNWDQWIRSSICRFARSHSFVTY